MFNYKGHYIFRYRYQCMMWYGAVTFKYGWPVMLDLSRRATVYNDAQYIINLWPRRRVLSTSIDDVLRQIEMATLKTNRVIPMPLVEVATTILTASERSHGTHKWKHSTIDIVRGKVAKVLKLRLINDDN